jgi:hypothetical protein
MHRWLNCFEQQFRQSYRGMRGSNRNKGVNMYATRAVNGVPAIQRDGQNVLSVCDQNWDFANWLCALLNERPKCDGWLTDRMPTSNTYARSASVAPPSGDGCRALSVVVFGCVLVVIGAYCLCPSAFAQISDSRTAEEPTKSWTATTDLKDDLIPERIPVRTIESHSENGNRTLDTRSVAIRGTDGHFEHYQEIERETLTVDASTAKTTMRTFARDVNRMKSLVQVTEEEKHILAGDDSNIVRVTYNSDVNGRLQPVQREIVETKNISKDLEETNTTVMLSSVNGGLVPAFKTHELRKRAANGMVETEKTTWLLDVNGKWQLSEIRQNNATQGAKGRSIEERVSRPDAEGKLGQISRVVSQETESEKRSVVETYSIDVPGTARDGSLHLVERKTSTEGSSSTGERATEQKVEQINPGDPGSGLRVSVLVDGKIIPEPSGEQSTVIIRARDSNGNFGIVSVDTTKADRIPTVQIQQTSAETP